jgi:large subunit ribosomal protein L6
MVVGVTTGYEKKLEVLGVGYRVQKQGTNLVMNLGYSHQVIIPEEDGITIEVPNPTEIIVKGADKQQVGQMAAVIRSKRSPEPYKGKGIRYSGEYVRRKEGKAGKGAKK